MPWNEDTYSTCTDYAYGSRFRLFCSGVVQIPNRFTHIRQGYIAGMAESYDWALAGEQP